jgi:hypothetical protein
MHHLFVNFGDRQRGVLPPTSFTRSAATPTMSTCPAPLHCPRASKLGFEPSRSGHNEGPGVNDHSCRRCHRCCGRHRHCCHRHCRCCMSEDKTKNDEEGACCCYHVSRKRADKGRRGWRSGRAGEALTHLKNLACHSVFLAACDSLLSGG